VENMESRDAMPNSDRINYEEQRWKYRKRKWFFASELKIKLEI